MRLRKQKKVVAVTLATAIAVSTISASASAVQYDLADGDVTIGQDETKGANSYQGDKDRTYVNEDKDDDGKIIINGDKDTSTSNTVTVQEDGNPPAASVPPTTRASTSPSPEGHPSTPPTAAP